MLKHLILVVAGARPNFMKVAPLMRALQAHETILAKLVHTGQHYDENMSGCFFDEFDIGAPEFHLKAGSASHGVQTAKILVAFEKLCLRQHPDLVVVVGDVNSTIACALAAKKLCIPVVHVEAGLRSFDRSMPEEINRIATDSITDLFFVTEESGQLNLLSEGHDPAGIHFVGNLMIDNLHHQLRKLPPGAPPAPHYVAMTLHRPSNVDDPKVLARLLGAVSEIAKELPVYFPVHPRTRARIEEFDLGRLFHSGFHRLPPLPYGAFLSLWKDADLVITDSGGLQEETTALGIPCFTLRDNTERPITVSQGSNTLLGCDADALLGQYARFRSGEIKRGVIPALWDGHTGQRIAAILEEFLASREIFRSPSQSQGTPRAKPSEA
jgi:UDP-N-acetylglucosamine 2-epimerase (non-hydrolysing)